MNDVLASNSQSSAHPINRPIIYGYKSNMSAPFLQLVVQVLLSLGRLFYGLATQHATRNLVLTW